MWGSLIGAGVGLLGGLLGKKKEQYDPLASIRGQLQGLAQNVGGIVQQEKQANQRRATMARESGTRGINEGVYANRGMGRTSIQDRLSSELSDKLFASQAEADLAAEKWGVDEQARILGSMAGMYPEQQEEPNWWEGIGKAIGGGIDTWDSRKREDALLDKFLGSGSSSYNWLKGSTPTDFGENFTKVRGVIKGGNAYDDFYRDAEERY